MHAAGPAVRQSRLLSILLIAMVLAGLVGAANPQSASAANTQPVQVFYLPMVEDQVLAAFKKINTTATIAGPMHSVTGISVTSDGSVLYYDQWENGYELDLANPGSLWTSSTTDGTQIWGNGKASDGCPPTRDGRTVLTCSDLNDVLLAGDVIVLENDVSTPRVTSETRYDARDKLGATKVVAVTRSVWANTPGTVLADAIEVYDTTRWGTSFEVPVGQNNNSVTNSMFSYTGGMITAAQNGTSVWVDADANGVEELTLNLNQGDTYQINGGLFSGATVRSSKPVQLNLLTGKVGSTYASRWFQLPPTNLWTSSLWTAVGTTNSSYPAAVYVFNPSNSAPLTVYYQTKLGTGSFSVAANGVYRFQMPVKSGAHFYTDSTPFLAVGVMDSSASGSDQTYDWGYTLVSDAWLTTAFVAGWAPGTYGYTANGSPVWVTAVSPTTVYVDYGSPAPPAGLTAPNGKSYDVSYALGAYESLQIKGLANTQTGMKVFTADNTSITGAWGEDPSSSQAGTPYLDVGYTIPPLPEVVITKSAALAPGGDLNSDGKIGPGDTMLYTLTVRNNGAVTAFNTLVTDSIPTHTTYVANSTTLNGAPVADDPAAVQGYPLQYGVVVGTIPVTESAVFTYKMTADPIPPSAPYASVVNTAHALINGTDLVITIVTPIHSNATSCGVLFTDAGGASVEAYQTGSTIYLKLTDADTAGLGPLHVAVVNAATGDRENVTLTEGAAGVFSGSVPSSSTLGQTPDDGTLYARPGDTLSIQYTDPVYTDTCSDSAVVQVPSQVKTLYLEEPSQGMTRTQPSDAVSATSIYRLGTGSGSTTVNATFVASKDNTIRSATAVTGTNYGASPSLTTSRMSTDKYRILLGFDLSSIPTNATITAATLSLYKTGSSSTSSTAYQTDVLAAPAAWTEGTGGAAGVAGVSNWNQRITGTNWGTAGGGPLGSVLASTNVTTNASNVWYNWSGAAMLTQIQNWVTNPATNYGFLIKRTSETSTSSTRTHVYASREYATATYRPKLVLTYTVPNTTVTSTDFVQTAAMASDLNMPGGAAVSVTTYINVESGSMPSPLSLSATAELRDDSTSLITLSNPTVTAVSGSVYRVVWSGTLSAGTKTLAAGHRLTVRYATTQAGVVFSILYGSTTYPSRVELPSVSIIKVNSLDFYDAPYPGGAQILNPANGQTIYVRAVVSDPFGEYDVTAATLNISGPSSYSASASLTSANVVATSATSKTYEYAWTAPAAQGEYTFSLTAKEGLENTVTDTLSKPVTIIFKDTGTPSQVEFTTTDDGAATTTYDGAAATTSVCMRLTDYDKAGRGTLNVTVRSSNGDLETVTLIESASKPGVFTACMPRDTSASPTTGNGTLNAPAGAVLTVSYTDPNDSTDKSSGGAMLTTSSAALSIVKLAVNPSDGIAVVGEAVSYDLVITNPSGVDLSTVAVTDTFPSACLSYVSASVAPDSTTATTLVWDDVGPLEPHASVTLRVYFTAAAQCSAAANINRLDATALDPSDNTVTATQSTSSFTITNPALTVTKTRTSGTPAAVGTDVSFQITLHNTGSTVINSLPLNDTYSPYCMEVKTASDGGSGSGGTVLWSDLGPLAVGASKTVTVTFTVKGPCTPAQNLAVVDSATDANNDAVPTAYGSATVTTTVLPPAFTVTKTLTTPASGPYYVGDLLTYTVDIHNTGDNALLKVTVTDAIPSCLSFVSALPQPPSSVSAAQAKWDTLVPPEPPILAGQTLTMTVRMRVIAAADTCQNSVSVSIVDQYDQSAGPQTSQVSVKTLNAIRGVVFDDLNANGTQEAGESGLAGAVVNLYSPGTDGLLGTADDTLVGTITTDASGAYLFGDLPAGQYLVRETNPPGYASTTADSRIVTLPATGGATVNFGDRAGGTINGVVFNDLNGSGVQDAGEAGLAGLTVTLKDSSGGVVGTTTTAADGSYQFTGLSAGQYTVIETDGAGYTSTTPNSVSVSLPDGGVASANFGDRQNGTVSGAVYVDLNGNGVQDAGESGLPGVTIELRGGSCTPGVSCPTAVTDSSGNYQFTGVTPGAYSVVETDPSGYSSTTSNILPVSVPPGGSASASFGDRPAGSVSGVVFNDLNGNGVQDAGEPGLAGVSVDLYQGGSVVGSTVTDGSGAYQFTGLPGGAYIVKEAADPAGFTSVTSNSVPVSLPDGGSASANFADRAVGTVSGVYFNDLNGSGVQDAGEPGIGGVIVQLRDGTCIPGLNCLTTTTAGDGSYSFTGVTGGSYQVATSAPAGFTPTTPTVVSVVVPAGGAGSANFGANQIGSLSGVVFNDLNGNGIQDAGEMGIGGVTVELQDGACTPGADCPTAVTTGNGSYLFTDLIPGTYAVVETDPSGYTSTTPNTVSAVVPAGGSVSVNFGDLPANSISGVVFVDLNGNGTQDPGEAGIGGVTIELRSASCTSGVDCPTAATASDGSYYFGGLTPGSFTVVETDPSGYASTTPNSVPVTLPAGGSGTANFGDLPAGSIGGVVFYDLNTDGSQNFGEKGVGGVKVELQDGVCTPGSTCPTALTDANGAYLFSGLPAGSYTVVETLPSGYVDTTPASVPVTLSSGGVGSANFGLVQYDFGDLPATYGDPSHTLGDLFLGAGVSAETAAQPSANASLDSLDDGITLLDPSAWRGGASVGLSVKASQNAVLVAWFDWDHSGTFESGEKVIWNVSAGSGSVSLTIPGAAGTSITALNARFRIYPAGTDTLDLNPTNAAENGEVEDYAFSFNPTAVTLVSLSASAQGWGAWAWLAALLAGLAGLALARRKTG